MPGPPLSPADAIKKMTVPDGFTVELVASEPDIVNPVAMTFDERGRIWITESLEYPRASAGPGKDRIKILEDTHGDGKFDKVTIFADGLNIPSGIAVGHGGVWVANSPDILFLQDTKGTGKAGKPEVVVTGFGRYDTHELPNSLTWGPDGWLYGSTASSIPPTSSSNGKTFDFTCAMFRINPRTREFQIFCRGHEQSVGHRLERRGRRLRQRLRHRPFMAHDRERTITFARAGPIRRSPGRSARSSSTTIRRRPIAASTVSTATPFRRSTATSCSWATSTAAASTCDEIKPDGSTYVGTARPDFLTANDAWFMPVSQKIGPDGCLYILDWYDRYHCYQDANRDPDRHRPRHAAASTAFAIKILRAPEIRPRQGERRSARSSGCTARTSSSARWRSGCWPSGPRRK